MKLQIKSKSRHRFCSVPILISIDHLTKHLSEHTIEVVKIVYPNILTIEDLFRLNEFQLHKLGYETFNAIKKVKEKITSLMAINVSHTQYEKKRADHTYSLDGETFEDAARRLALFLGITYESLTAKSAACRIAKNMRRLAKNRKKMAA